MSKKIISALIITLTTASTFAYAQTLPWSINSGSAVWHIANSTGSTNVAFTVNKYITGRPGVISDPIHLICGSTNTTVNPGATVSCHLSSYLQGDFQIAAFKNGSEGSYTVS